jgi:hypothetical protein
MTIPKLVAGANENDPLASTGAQVATAVNGLIDGVYSKTGFVKVGGGMGDNALFKDRTRQANILLKGMPRRVRIHLLNSSTTTGLSGVKASIAATENLSAAPLPSGGIGAFTLFTFASTTAAAATGTGDNATPSTVKSNWLDFAALPRNDGGNGYIIMIRLYQDAASSGTQMTIGNTTQMTDFAAYQVTCFYAQANGDFTTSATTMTTNANVQPFFLEIEYETNNCSVAIVGDSIMAGANAGPAATGSNASGAAFKAIKRIYENTSKRVSLFNSAWGGSSTTGGSGATIPTPVRGYYGQFLAYLSSGARPNIAAFCPWSVNNTLAYDAGQVSAVTTISNRFVTLCIEHGITPALVTPAPRNGITESEESVRRQCVQAIKAVASARGVLLIDRDSVFTNYDLPTGGYKLPEWCTDIVHPTEIGHSVESTEWENKLLTVI